MGICSSHFRDPFVIKFIKERLNEEYCEICKDARPSVDFEALQDFVKDAVYSEYCDPYAAGAPYDPDGGDYEHSFWGLKVYYIYDLLYDVLDVEEHEIIERLARSFGDDFHLAPQDKINGPSKDEYFGRGWTLFKEILKHKVRFLFFDPNLKSSFEDEYEQSLNPVLILEEVGKAIHELDIILIIPTHTTSIYRGRQHQLSEFISSSDNLGSPPPAKAKANRMSPPGISMFYAALDIETCRREIIDNSLNYVTAFTSGEFLNIKELRVVDFTSITEVPSIFDEENRHNRPILKFILSFIKDLSIPVKPDDSVHVEYIPTQVVTEYIRLKLKVDGIIYNSVKHRGGLCMVIFAENSQVTNLGFKPKSDENILALLKDSLVTDIIPAFNASGNSI